MSVATETDLRGIAERAAAEFGPDTTAPDDHHEQDVHRATDLRVLLDLVADSSAAPTSGPRAPVRRDGSVRASGSAPGL